MCVILRHGVRAFDLTRLARCGARTRSRGGAPCRRYGTLRNGRCKLHGGRSTGPRMAARLATARRCLRHGYFAGERLRWRAAMRRFMARIDAVLGQRTECRGRPTDARRMGRAGEAPVPG